MKIVIIDKDSTTIVTDIKNIDYMCSKALCTGFTVSIKGKEFYLTKDEYKNLEKILKAKRMY